MKSHVFGILFSVALGALSMGCAAQAGTDDTSQAEQGLTVDQYLGGAQKAQQEALTKQRIQQLPHALVQPVHSNELPVLELKDLSGTDPGGNVQDDGDGKEPDPHPWHTSTTATVAH